MTTTRLSVHMLRDKTCTDEHGRDHAPPAGSTVPGGTMHASNKQQYSVAHSDILALVLVLALALALVLVVVVVVAVVVVVVASSSS